MDLVLSLIREIYMKNMNQSLKKGKEKKASRLFMMKRISFKRMIWRSCRMTNTLLRKIWLFPDEMKIRFM
ncbi:hypothetical protein Godav_028824 [Gossypium davidsonii]|uniref:Uncharacterized protein n=1 Tax=Gossypium davidsonii TaxID=34287 RepID=A0A7J8TKK4_GOSDV|nr:hypothetical protein [Gossypium davidsonii]